MRDSEPVPYSLTTLGHMACTLGAVRSMMSDLPTDGLEPGELELVLLRTELRAMVKRWRNNLAQDGAGTRSRRELVALMCAQIECILEGGR